LPVDPNALPASLAIVENAPYQQHRLDVTDPEELVEAIRGSRIDARLLGRRPGVSQLERVQLPRTCLDTLRVTSPLLATGEMPADCYTLVYVRECPEEGHEFNLATRHGSGYIGFYAPGGALDAFVPAGYANATLTIPKDLLLQELASRFPEAPAEWLGKGAGVCIPEPSRRRICGLLGARLDLDRADPGWLADHAVRRNFEDDLIGVFAEAMRGSWDHPRPTVSVLLQKRYGVLRLIRDHIADHRGAPLRLDALCEVSGMSRRGLEYLFKDHFGIGVNAFVRCQRLHGARKAICDSAPGPGVVKRIALEWGFWHLGRFAHDYQACFGESPSVTLSRQRRSGIIRAM
jgi:AraC-like DNA-binding protein